MHDEVVLTDVRSDGVAVLTLNRPDRLNAWTVEMEDRYFDLLLDAQHDPTVRAIVVTGAGRAFSAGADLGSPGEGMDTTQLQLGSLDRRPTTLPLEIAKPIVAAINGPAAGASLVHTLQMDVRFAAAGAKLTFAFPRLGLVAEYGASWLLPRLVGTGHALDLLLSGRVITAEEACELGLVNRVVPVKELFDVAVAYAADLAVSCSPASMAVIKQQVHADRTTDLEAARVRAAGLMARSFGGADAREGVRSFLGRRPPAFPPLGEGSPWSL
jgi:enoyl-CoA hydratase/carnithine racemase